MYQKCDYKVKIGLIFRYFSSQFRFLVGGYLFHLMIIFPFFFFFLFFLERGSPSSSSSCSSMAGTVWTEPRRSQPQMNNDRKVRWLKHRQTHKKTEKQDKSNVFSTKWRRHELSIVTNKKKLFNSTLKSIARSSL